MPKLAEKKVGSASKKNAVKAEKPIKIESAQQEAEATNAPARKLEHSSYKEKASEIEANIMAKINANPAVANDKFRKVISVNKLMETGAHIGLTSKRWNPKMKQYVYTKKGNNHIIDLLQTVISLSNAYNYLMNLSKNDGSILIVGTRGKTIKNHVKEEAKRVQAFYINERWLGGTLTNFTTISKSINKFNKLLYMQKFGEIEKFTKKEQVAKRKETEKLAKFFGGIRTMKALPDAIVLTDPENEKIALLEAKKLGIKVVAICNTNANPENIDYVIPANNYSIKSVYLLIGLLCDAIAEGKNLPKSFVGKKDDEIVLPEIVKKKPDFRKVVYDRPSLQTQPVKK